MLIVGLYSKVPRIVTDIHQKEQMASGDAAPPTDTSPWTIREDQIEQKERLGKGGYGKVYWVIWTKDSGEKVDAAGKYIDDYDPKAIEKEIRLLSEADHPNIIEYYGAVKGEHATIIVTELARKGDLYSHLQKLDKAGKKLPIGQLLKWVRDAACALEYLHDTNNVTHRDVKSKNFVIMEDETLKLCDFGLSMELDTSDITSKKRGTLRYKSPELLEGGEVGDYVDVYAFAILVWEMITCLVPYGGYNSDQIRQKVISNKRPTIPSDCLITFKTLLRACWHPDKKNRYDMGTVVAVIDREIKLKRLEDLHIDSETPAKSPTADKSTCCSIMSIDNSLGITTVMTVEAFGRVSEDETWSPAGEFSTEPELPSPWAITIHPNGDVAVTNNREQAHIFSKDGDPKFPFAKPGDDNHTSLSDIAVSREKYIIPGITKFLYYNEKGHFLTNSTSLIYDPATLAIDSKRGRIIAGSKSAFQIHNGDDGREISYSKLDMRGMPYVPVNLCNLDINSNDYIVAVFDDLTINLIQKNGRISERNVPACPEGVNLWVPMAVCCSKKQGEIFVVNDGDKSVYLYRADGKCLGCIISGLDSPMGIAITKDEQQLYVVEQDLSLVKKFQRPPGLHIEKMNAHTKRPSKKTSSTSSDRGEESSKDNISMKAPHAGLVSGRDIQDIVDIFSADDLDDVYTYLNKIERKDIRNAGTQYAHSLKDQAKILLNLWCDRNSEAATRDAMIRAMEQCTDCKASMDRLKREWGYSLND